MLRRRPGHRDAHPARLTWRTGTALLLLAAGALGCGGDEEATQRFSEPPPLTKAEFLREADRICFATEAQIEAAADDLAAGGDDPPPAEVRRVVEDFVVPRLRTEVDTIRLLDPPPADEARIERILVATERGADALEADPLRVLDGIPPPLREAERLARAYGSEQCGLRGG